MGVTTTGGKDRDELSMMIHVVGATLAIAGVGINASIVGDRWRRSVGAMNDNAKPQRVWPMAQSRPSPTPVWFWAMHSMRHIVGDREASLPPMLPIVGDRKGRHYDSMIGIGGIGRNRRLSKPHDDRHWWHWV